MRIEPTQFAEKLCVCGKPLHYFNEKFSEMMQKIISEMGEFVTVKVLGTNECYLVPRHFIALHGLDAKDLPRLAVKYGFKKK